MLGQNESDSEEEGTLKGKRKRGADDLDFDDEGLVEWSRLGAGLDQTSAPLSDLDDEDVPTVVQRIRTLYHTSLGADNKFKLQVC